MTLFSGKEKYCEWIKGFDTTRLVNEVYILEKLIDADGFIHSLLLEDTDFLLNFIKDEIIMRVAIERGVEVYNG